MTTPTVTPEVETPEVETPRHFADCDSLAIGRRVKALAVDGLRREFVADLAVPLDTYRGNCSCFVTQLKRVEHDLTTARKCLKRSDGFGANGEDDLRWVQTLTAQRAALKAVIEVAR